MAKSVEFLFDFGSPNAYLAYTQLPGIAARAGAALIWTPILLGGVFKATGNRSPAEIPAKAAYLRVDGARFVKRAGGPFARNPHLPVNTLAMMRGAVSYPMDGDFDGSVTARFEAMWVAPRNLTQPAELGAALQAAGFEAEDFMDRIGRQAVKDKLMANTQAAVERGVFGAPTMFVGDEIFFGQDRLDFVEAALAG